MSGMDPFGRPTYEAQARHDENRERERGYMPTWEREREHSWDDSAPRSEGRGRGGGAGYDGGKVAGGRSFGLSPLDFSGKGYGGGKGYGCGGGYDSGKGYGGGGYDGGYDGGKGYGRGGYSGHGRGGGDAGYGDCGGGGGGGGGGGDYVGNNDGGSGGAKGGASGGAVGLAPLDFSGGGYGGGKGYGGGSGGGGGGPPISEEDVLQLIEERNNAKNRREFDEADRVRDQLKGRGVSIDDRARTWSTADGRSGRMAEGGGFARGDKDLGDGTMSWANTIFIQGLPHSIKPDDLVDFFGRIGPIKKSKKSHNMGEPTVHIYMDKQTRRPKGEATVSYEDSDTAKSAVEWFNGADFMEQKGQKLSVSIARRPSQGNWGKGGKGGKGKGKGGGRW